MEENPVEAIVKNPEHPGTGRIARMPDEAMDLLGGMESIVRPGDYVVIKGNFFAPYPPPVSVDRRVAAALIAALRRAGAARVTLCEAVSIGARSLGMITLGIKNFQGILSDEQKYYARRDVVAVLIIIKQSIRHGSQKASGNGVTGIVPQTEV